MDFKDNLEYSQDREKSTDEQIADFEEQILSANRGLLKNFAADMNTNVGELENLLKLVGHYDQLVTMATQVNKTFQTNPKAYINFGEYGANVARQFNLNPDQMFQAILASGYSDLLLNIVSQLNSLYKSTNTLKA